MVIKNFHKIADLIPLEKHNDLDRAANLHLRHSNIEFKIIGVDGKDVTVRTTQGKHMSENYANDKTLIKETRELFSRFLPGYTIFTHPVVYTNAIVDIVNSEWIAEKMLKKGIRIKDLQIDTGIDKTNLSAWINGVRPMSQPVKAMFYFYFLR